MSLFTDEKTDIVHPEVLNTAQGTSVWSMCGNSFYYDCLKPDSSPTVEPGFEPRLAWLSSGCLARQCLSWKSSNQDRRPKSTGIM